MAVLSFKKKSAKRTEEERMALILDLPKKMLKISSLPLPKGETSSLNKP